MKIVSFEELGKDAAYLRLILYGNPGTGKTWCAASAAYHPSTWPCFLLHCRGQVGSLLRRPGIAEAIELKRLFILDVDYGDLNTIYHWLAGHSSVKELDGIWEGARPKTVVVDSVSEMFQSVKLWISGAQPGDIYIPPVPKIQHWGDLLSAFTLLSRNEFDLPMHVVFSLLETFDVIDVTDGLGKKMGERLYYRPYLQGKSQEAVPAYARVIMRLERQQGKTTAWGQEEPLINAGYTSSPGMLVKDQDNVFPDLVPNPTIPRMVALLQKGVMPTT